jgi:hypothetical protein
MGEEKLNNGVLNDLYTPLNIFRVINSRKIRCVWHVTQQGRGEAFTGCWGKPEGKKPLGRPTMR